jgi:hypothetical protein
VGTTPSNSKITMISSIVPKVMICLLPLPGGNG